MRVRAERLPHRVVTLSALFLGLAAPLMLRAQTGTIVGNITDEAGAPVTTAQVLVEGTGLGVVSAADGAFTITNVPAGTHTIVAQRIGYTTTREGGVAVGAGETITLNLTISQTVLTLEGIVATGLVDPVEGVRSPITIGRITRDQLPVPVAGSALANIGGRIAGVSMSRVTGQPGEEVQIQLRTVTSALSGADPLIVVDGVILGGGTANIESLDIESIEVIKGASAASLYGSRAAAGVISITTRRGQDLELGETQFSARTEIGIQQVSRGKEMVAPPVHPYAMNEAQTTYVDPDGNPVGREDRFIPRFAFMENPFPGPIFDNQSVIFDPGIFQSQSLSMAQNTASTNFAITFNRYNEQGALQNNDGYTRNSGRINLDHRFLDNMSLGISAYHARDFRDDLQLSFTDVARAPRDVDLSLKDESGQFVRIPDPNVAYENPLWEEASRDNERNSSRTLASANYRWSPLNWLELGANISYDHEFRSIREYTPKGTPTSVTSDRESDGVLELSEFTRDTGNGEVQVSLSRDFGLLNARTTFRGLAELDRLRRTDTEATDFFVTGVPQQSAASSFENGSLEEEIKALGGLWDTAFDYAGKYIATVLLRYDGSSLFGSDNRWHGYYRVAGAWRMAEEDWFNVPHIDEFKLSYARGTAGGRPSFEAQYETWQVSPTGISKGTLGNVDLAPELTTEQEVSVEAILAGRLGVDLVYAWQTTEDQLVTVPVPAFTGYSQQWANGGTVKGNTWELSLEGQLYESPTFGWTSTFVFDRSTGKVGNWPGTCVNPSFRFICTGTDLYGLYGGGRVNKINGDRLSLEIHNAGSALGQADEFQVNDDGYLVWVGPGGDFQDGRWGESTTIEGVRYEFGMPFDMLDENGNRARPQLGNADHMNLGLINTFRFGPQLTLDTHFTGSLGGQAYQLEDRTLIGTNQSPQMDQRGKPEGLKKPVEYYEALRPFGSPQLESTDFFKVRLVGVTYRLSQGQLTNWGMSRIGIRRLSVGLVGRDLLTVTDFRSQDPEFALNVATGQVFSTANRYPPTRTFTAELQVGF